MSDIIRVIRANVELGDYSFDAYEMPNGEKRIGYAGASNILGYQKNWLGRLQDSDSKQLQLMQGTGYTGLHQEVEIWERSQGGGSKVNTISVRDFIKLAVYEGLRKKNERGVIILAAMAESGIEQTIEMAFAGKSLDRILSKIKHYTTWTYEELMEAFADNREDALSLRLGMGGS